MQRPSLVRSTALLAIAAIAPLVLFAGFSASVFYRQRQDDLKVQVVADARRVSEAIDRPVDVVIANTGRPSLDGLMKYAAEHKEPLELGELDSDIEVVEGRFWCTEIARHDRRRLSFAVWSVLSERLLRRGQEEREIQKVQ